MEKKRGIIIVGGHQELRDMKAVVKADSDVVLATSTTHTASPFEPEPIPFKISERYKFEHPKYYPAKGSKYHK